MFLTLHTRAANDIITLNFVFKWLRSASATVQLAATHPPVTFLREGLSIQFREGQSRHKCKHISVIIEAGTHKAKYRAVMQSVTWLWVEFTESQDFTLLLRKTQAGECRYTRAQISPMTQENQLRFSPWCWRLAGREKQNTWVRRVISHKAAWL